MTTCHVLDQLPHWVEGELNPTQSMALQAHLDACPACKAEAEHLRASQGWLRESMESPFDARDGEDLRRTVLAQISRQPRAPRIWQLSARPALLAACAAALLVVGLASLTKRTRTILPAPSRPLSPTASLQAPSAPVPALPSPSPPRISGPLRGRPRSREAPLDLSTSTLTRVEFQIPDSHIRIIWLTQAKPALHPSSTPQETL